MTGLLMPLRVGVLGGAAPSPVIADVDGGTVSNADSWNFGTVSFGATAVAGDLIVAIVAGYDNDTEDPAFNGTISGTWTAQYTDSDVGIGTSFGCCMAWKAASGGETGIAVSGSWSGFSGTMDDNKCRVLLVRGVTDSTAEDFGVATSTLNTTGCVFACGALITSASGGGDLYQGDMTAAHNYWYDIAPLGGSADDYGGFGPEVCACWS